ncbi:MAG: hypothetical protein HZA04_05490 [Nitrospinae bacterium]|nr:hypothetical protein [Nitrospinota bacterium]
MKKGNIEEQIKKAKEKTAGKEGGAMRDAKKKVKRLQRAKRKIAVAKKRQAGKKAEGATPAA